MRACVRGTGGRVCGGCLHLIAHSHLYYIMTLHVVSMLFQEINKHSYGILCCSPLTMAHNLFHDVGVETLYTDYIVWGKQ